MPLVHKIRRVLPYLSIAVLLVVVYDAWVFYSRRERAHQVQEQRAAKEAEDAHRTLELIGQLKILNFYAAPSAIERGHSARLCYSVVGAKTVRIEPNVDGVYPALSHCIEISPAKDTEYTFFAADETGHTVNAKTAIRVLAHLPKGASN